MAALFGNIGTFHGAKEEWTQYIESKALRYIDNSNYHDIFENIVIYYFHLKNIGSIEISIKLKLIFRVY